MDQRSHCWNPFFIYRFHSWASIPWDHISECKTPSTLNTATNCGLFYHYYPNCWTPAVMRQRGGGKPREPNIPHSHQLLQGYGWMDTTWLVAISGKCSHMLLNDEYLPNCENGIITLCNPSVLIDRNHENCLIDLLGGSESAHQLCNETALKHFMPLCIRAMYTLLLKSSKLKGPQKLSACGDDGNRPSMDHLIKEVLSADRASHEAQPCCW
jgi:hypothetical protein